MKLNTTQTHFSELLDAIRDNGSSAAGSDLYLSKTKNSPIQRLAVSRYTDDNRYQQERRRLFKPHPLVLEHISRIPPGHCLPHDGYDIPLLISNDGGQIRVFLNQCRHRSTRLLNGEHPCQLKRIMCPYHNWVYKLDGQLHALPQPQGFPDLDKSANGLIEIPHAIRGGLIFAIPDWNQTLDIDAWLGETVDYLQELDTPDYTFFRHSNREYACNWKLPVDAFLEAYHLHRLHKDTLGPLFSDNLALGKAHGHHMSAAVARTHIKQALALPPADWDLRNHVTFSLYLLPNTVIIYHPDYISLVRFFPLAAGRCRIEHSMLIPETPKTDKEQAHWDRAFEMTDEMSFAAEDFHICEQMQLGMQAGGMSDLLLGNYELTIQHFHRQLDQLMDA